MRYFRPDSSGSFVETDMNLQGETVATAVRGRKVFVAYTSTELSNDGKLYLTQIDLSTP